MTAVADTTRRQQLAMARFLRDPAAASPPAGVEHRRLQVYRDLIYNNIEGFVSGAFPVLRSLYADPDWHALVRLFIDRHSCRSPYFLEISQEFLRYLMERHEPRSCDPPFLLELAHYEWLELALDVSEEEVPTAGVDPAGDLLQGIPVLSPLVMAAAYDYPVHRIGPGFRPQAPDPQPTFLIVYRDRGDSVRFMEANAATVQLLDLLRENVTASGTAVLQQLATALGLPPASVLDYGGPLLRQLAAQSIIAGTRRQS
jgi:hypothetical protein